MTSLETQVVVVGGGATGVAALRDLARRGIDAVLVERDDLGSGTSGRWHGLLHSGGRYVVKDPVSARECIDENRILRRIAPHCIELTGGLFVLLADDDQSYGDKFVAGCTATGVDCEELTADQAHKREPALGPAITRVFEVPDGTFDSWALMRSMRADAEAHGAKVLTRNAFVGTERDGERIAAVRVRTPDGEERSIGCTWVLNTAGAWAGQVAAMAGVELNMAPGKGSMVVMSGRYVSGPVNMCRPPSDGDIIVPVHEVAILGTTDVEVDDPDDIHVDPAEVDFMIDSCARMVPALASARAMRAFSGSRPLYRGDDDGGGSRDISRTFIVLEHDRRGEVDNMVSIVGGKLTTCRMMAEHAVDVLAARLDVTTPCTTATEPLPGAEHGGHVLAAPFGRVEHEGSYGELICECELVTRGQVEAALDDGVHELEDLRRRLRLGFGPCQAGFCGWRAAAMLAEHRDGAGGNGAGGVDGHAAGAERSADDVLANLGRFLGERWRGQQTTLWGDQARQALLNAATYRATLGLGTLRAGVPGSGGRDDGPAGDGERRADGAVAAGEDGSAPDSAVAAGGGEQT